jgi:hypothetical protein
MMYHLLHMQHQLQALKCMMDADNVQAGATNTGMNHYATGNILLVSS